MVNGEPLTILAKKSNHRCLTLSKIQLSLSLFLSLSLTLSLSAGFSKDYWDKIIGKLPAFSMRHFLSACIHARTCLVVRNAYHTLLLLVSCFFTAWNLPVLLTEGSHYLCIMTTPTHGFIPIILLFESIHLYGKSWLENSSIFP